MSGNSDRAYPQGQDPTNEIPGPLLAELRALVGGDLRIEAIKRYRLATGASLAEATQAIDDLAAGRNPRPVARAASGSTPSLLLWQVRRTVPFTMAKAIGLLRLFAGFLWLCALIMGATATWQTYERHSVSSTWPQTKADIVACRVERYNGTTRSLVPTAALACAFRYSAGGKEYQAETRSHSTKAPELTAAMRRWVDEHPPGSQQTIYYDPDAPANISLGEADGAFESNTPKRSLRAALIFTVGGALFFAGGLWLAARQQRREADSSGQ